MSGQLPLLSVNLEMLKSVILTFLNFMKGYVLLMIAFSLGFNILFKERLQQDGTVMFSNPLLYLIGTVVMLTGDFDSSNLSFDILSYTSRVIFLLFIFLVAIILLNLLNGLAVSDTHEIHRNAETLSLVARVKLILKFETSIRAIQRWMTCSVEEIKEMCVLYPNRRNKIGSPELRHLLSTITKKRQANKKWESTVIQDKWDALQLRLDKLEKR